MVDFQGNRQLNPELEVRRKDRSACSDADTRTIDRTHRSSGPVAEVRIFIPTYTNCPIAHRRFHRTIRAERGRKLEQSILGSQGVRWVVPPIDASS